MSGTLDTAGIGGLSNGFQPGDVVLARRGSGGTATLGTLPASQPYVLPAATSAQLGGVLAPSSAGLLGSTAGGSVVPITIGTNLTLTGSTLNATSSGGGNALGVAISFTGDGTTTSFTVTHNLNSYNVMVQVVDTSTGNNNATIATLEPTRPSANTVVVPFQTAPVNGAPFLALVLKVA